ncbi:MAG TPA: hypothetical protein VGM88_30335 [Kofleriaceae bacterium]
MIVGNPFFVLGLAPSATRMEAEREAQKLLGMLELGFPQVATYATPLGPQPRTAEAVRAAVAALRDPYQRLVAEVWARHAPERAESPPAPAAPVAYPGLRARLGWSR